VLQLATQCRGPLANHEERPAQFASAPLLGHRLDGEQAREVVRWRLVNIEDPELTQGAASQELVARFSSLGSP
jgi:hypothetical protein